MKHKNKLGIAVTLLDAISKTWRISLQGEMPVSPCLIAFWHGQMLPVWKLFASKNAAALVSLSKDGQILSSLLEKWGFDLARGSSSRQSEPLLPIMIEKAKSNYLLITPDGPRGPALNMKAGAVIAAQRAGVPLYLCGVEIGSKFTFKNSWDNFILPLPFSKISISLHKYGTIDNNLNKEEINQIISDAENMLRKVNGFHINSGKND